MIDFKESSYYETLSTCGPFSANTALYMILSCLVCSYVKYKFYKANQKMFVQVCQENSKTVRDFLVKC